MIYKRFLLVALLLSVVISAKAQRYTFPDEPDAFINYVKEILDKTKRTNSIDAAVAFQGVWDGSLTASEKEQVIKISQKMLKARATAGGIYTDFYRTIASIKNNKASYLASYLEVSEKVIQKIKNTKEVLFYFQRLNLFFAKQALHDTRYGRLYTFGDFKLDFIEKRDETLQSEFTPTTSNDAEIEAIPELTGPVLQYENVNVTFATSFDSTSIHKTKGIFLIPKNTFIGKGGKFDWSSLDLDKNKAFVEFDTYSFNVAKPILNAKYVTFTYTYLIDRSIKGDFEFVSRPRKDIYSAKYPKFVSRENNIEIDKFGADLKYKGGFTLEGRQVYSTSSKPGATSEIVGEKDYNKAFKILSNRFSINDSIISSPNVKLALYLGESDSLYHAALQFKYLKKDYAIQMIRDRNKASGNTPFINNHHEFYIDADVVKYNIEKDSMDIFMLSGAQELRPAIFESFDYFNQDRYNKMLGIYDFHPLKLFTTYAQQVDTVAFYAGDLAKTYRKNEGIVRSVANNLESYGYLDYDENTGLISLGKRINQTDSANLFLRSVERVDRGISKQRDSTIYNMYDYDNFRIESSVSGLPNASLSRQNNELVIRGIKSFPMSEKLGVYIIPDSSIQRIRVYGGRNLYMEKGEVTVGNFRFIGKNFFLLYDEFSLEMPEIDNILFAIQDTTTEEKEWHEYGKEINFSAGNMRINDRLNKSGVKKGKIHETDNFYESFPKLNIPQGGIVYFHTDYRQDFSYDSTRSYFQIHEIEMDSLNTKTPIFPGTFVSNMFKEFEEDLIPMQAPDLTMGFIHTPPSSGYDLYPNHELIKNAHVTFSKDLVMNRDGLASGGELTYLTTRLKAPEFMFMPDSVNADNIEFEVKSGTLNGAEFAQATGKTAQLNWQAVYDKMIITNKNEMVRLENARDGLAQGAFEQRYKEKLFTLYADQEPVTLKGNLNVSADGLRGEGNLVRKDFSILSVSEEPFKFEKASFSANNVEFRINSKERDPYLFDRGFFYTNNKAVLLGNFVTVDFDLTAGKANVKPDTEFGDFASLSLPYAEYKTSIKEAIWDLNKKHILMTGDSTSRFTSTIFGAEDFNEENVTFNANKAFYDIPNLSMQVEGVPFINSADASIVPKDGKVVILKDAEMQELNEAIVLIDTLNRYHRLFDGHIKINSRIDFEGDATYQFVNVQKDTFNVKFDKFELIENEEYKGKKKRGGIIPRYTFAEGTVRESDNFYVTSRVLYKGQIQMYANRKDLSLDGFIKLDLSTRSDFNNWIPYKSDKGDEVFLEMDEKTEVGDEVITSGLHFSTAYDLYTSFLSKKEAETDKDIFLAKGILDYNPNINEFKISPKTKREGTSYIGNRLIFDDSKASIYIEGKFNFMDEFISEYLATSGSGRVNFKENQFNFDLLTAFDLPIDFKSIPAIQTAVGAKNPEKSIVLEKSDPLTNKVAEIAGEKDFKSFEESIGVRPIPLTQMSKRLKKPLIFSKVDFEWSEEYHTFYSKGPLHLLSIFDKVYDTDVSGYIELRKSASGDAFTIYFQADPETDTWFYFEIGKDKTLALSSDENFNGLVESKTVELAGIDKKEAFIYKFIELYDARKVPVKEKKEEEVKEEEEEEEEGEEKPEETKEEEVKEEEEGEEKPKETKEEEEEEEEGF